MAIKAGNFCVANLLLDKGANVCAWGQGMTVWTFAAERLHDTILFMKLLLDYGADVNFCPDPDPYPPVPWYRCETALVTAVRSSNLGRTRFLLDNGATLASTSRRDGENCAGIGHLKR